jgi:cullin-4
MDFLPVVAHVWEDHCDHMLTIRNIFLKLDRSYVLQTPGLLSIWDMGLKVRQ